MSAEEKIKKILPLLEERYPNPDTELRYTNLYELIVAVVLSAQCTDKRVNEVTPHFFQLYPNFEKLAEADPSEVAKVISSISYPNNKAKNLVALAKKVMSDYHGKVPGQLEALMALPGIGRKSANVILAVGFQIPAFPVDTHVFRVTHRLGLSRAKTPEKTEEEMKILIPPAEYIKAHHLFILHGRYVCKARMPLCEKCPLIPYCEFYRENLKVKPKLKEPI
jgi:endonuclease-3